MVQCVEVQEEEGVQQKFRTIHQFANKYVVQGMKMEQECLLQDWKTQFQTRDGQVLQHSDGRWFVRDGIFARWNCENPLYLDTEKCKVNQFGMCKKKFF